MLTILGECWGRDVGQKPEQLFENIFIINVPLPGSPLKNINSYLIKGTDRNLLIDTGFNTPVCYDVLNKGLIDLNADMRQTDIFLTHLHSDHSGLALSIASDNTKVFIGEADKKGMENFFKTEHWNLIDAQFRAFGFPQVELDENKSKNPASIYMPANQGEYMGICDGFVIDLGNYRLRCIDTPGHTPGHMCVYDEDHKILFSGDHIIFDITPNITSWMNVENSLGSYLQSLNKIKKLNIEFTLSAHRKAMGNCHTRIDELIHHHNVRINEVYQIVSNFGGITTYDAASKMVWSIRAKSWTEFPVAQKWFAVGEASAHLEYLRCKGMIKRDLINGKYFYQVNNPF
ncbi:MAG: MBL fold metallo-hydrolase [Dehalobacterium sp.]